jgi:hypothetical protein
MNTVNRDSSRGFFIPITVEIVQRNVETSISGKEFVITGCDCANPIFKLNLRI